MQPLNPLVGGTVLRTPGIQSPNFSQADQTGWAIFANGDAYFYNVTAEGEITTTTVVVQGGTGGVFIYSGSPASGNLIVAIAGAAGSDSESNSYIEGVQIGPSGNKAQIQLIPTIPDGNAAQIAFPMPNQATALSNTPNISAGVISDSDAVDLIISGPALGTADDEDWVQIIMYSNDEIGDSAHCDFKYIDTSGGATTVATYDADGWTFNGDVTFGSGVTFEGDVTIEGNLTVNGSLNGVTLPVSGTSDTDGLPDGTISGTSGAASTGTAHTHGPGSFAVTDGQHSHGAGTYEAT